MYVLSKNKALAIFDQTFEFPEVMNLCIQAAEKEPFQHFEVSYWNKNEKPIHLFKYENNEWYFDESVLEYIN